MTPAGPVNDLGTGSVNLLDGAPDQPLHASKVVLRVLNGCFSGGPADRRGRLPQAGSAPAGASHSPWDKAARAGLRSSGARQILPTQHPTAKPTNRSHSQAISNWSSVA